MTPDARALLDIMWRVLQHNATCTHRRSHQPPVVPTTMQGVTSSEVAERLRGHGIVWDVPRTRVALTELRGLALLSSGVGGSGFRLRSVERLEEIVRTCTT